MNEPTKAEICEAIREGIGNAMPAPGRILQAIRDGVERPLPTTMGICDAILEGVRIGTREAIGAYLRNHPRALRGGEGE